MATNSSDGNVFQLTCRQPNNLIEKYVLVNVETETTTPAKAKSVMPESKSACRMLTLSVTTRRVSLLIVTGTIEFASMIRQITFITKGKIATQTAIMSAPYLENRCSSSSMSANLNDTSIAVPKFELTQA